MAAVTEVPARSATFREVFGVGEYRALWVAQLVSIAGDQVARLALAVLVFARTGSAALAAVTFAVTAVAMFAGGLLFGWVADRFPRRAVMVTCDVVCTGLVLVMAVPGVPVAVLVGLLFVVTLAVEPFLAARQAVNRAVLGAERFQLGNGITIATYQVAQLAGFAAGGVVVAAVGVRPALLVDAASFAASAVIVRVWVRSRPAAGGRSGPGSRGIWAGLRVVFGSPVARTAMLLMWCAAFAVVPEGVVAPLSASVGGGAEGVGWLLAAMAAGAAVGPLVFNRLVGPARRMRWTGVLAALACAVLVLFWFGPGLAAAAVILAVSGLFTGYIATAGGALFEAVPDGRRGQASGVVGAGMSLGQGVVIVAAGVAAQRVSPGLVVACTGAVGTVAAVWLAVVWRAIHRAGVAAR